MTGDAKCRFCEHCQLHVHNLSAMRVRERRKFLKGNSGKVCITYLAGADGAVVREGFWHRLARPLRVAGAAALAMMLPAWFASCRKTGKLCPSSPQRLTGEAPNIAVPANPPPEKGAGKPAGDRVP